MWEWLDVGFNNKRFQTSHYKYLHKTKGMLDNRSKESMTTSYQIEISIKRNFLKEPNGYEKYNNWNRKTIICRKSFGLQKRSLILKG